MWERLRAGAGRPDKKGRGWRQIKQKNGKKRRVSGGEQGQGFFVLAVFFGAVVKGLKKNWQGQNKKALPVFQNALGGARV